MSACDIQDDPDLFELMLEDHEQSNPVYQVTQYWKRYFDYNVKSIRENGISNFRHAPVRTVWGFRADEETPDRFLRIKMMDDADGLFPDDGVGFRDVLDVFRLSEDKPVLPYGLTLKDMEGLAIRVAELTGQVNGAVPLSSIQVSEAGEPRHLLRDDDGRAYSIHFLDDYVTYAEVCRHIPFEKFANVIEIGAGSGKQVEVLRKAHPHLNVFVVDLPPSLYVASQYLKAVFGDAVVDYREAREKDVVSESGEGRITILPNRGVEKLRPQGPTLLWNSASFCEMEPHVVSNYIGHLRDHIDAVYLRQMMAGSSRGTPNANPGVLWSGVQEPTTFSHYEEFLGPDFRLRGRWQAHSSLRNFFTAYGYEDAVWARDAAPQS